MSNLFPMTISRKEVPTFITNIGTMRVPEGDLHCQCKLSIFSLSSFGPCIVFWILQKGTCIAKCIFLIFSAVTHQLKCKQTCIEKCRPRHKISMKKWFKIHQISKNVNLFPYITTNLHCSIRTEKLHRIKVKKKSQTNFGKIFYRGKTSFFRAKNLNVSKY